MKKRILIATGGTGGHLYPAISLADRLTQLNPALEVLFVGGKLKGNRCFENKAFAYREISSATFNWKNPVQVAKAGGCILRGIWESGQILNEFCPDAVVGFGSYYTLPILCAARWREIPIVLHEANRIPGKVNRLLSPHVLLTGVHFPDAALKLKGRTMEIPFPLRMGYEKGTMTSFQARSFFGLDSDRTTLLLFGGSQGAKKLNQTFMEALTELSAPFRKSIQILHLTGDDAFVRQLEEKYEAAHIKAAVKAFEPNMMVAWAAADLVIARSGAGTVAELMEFEVPAILIPYPYAADHHQEANADFVVDVVKGGVKYREADLTWERLKNGIESLLSVDAQPLTQMRVALREAKQLKRGKKELWDLLLEILNSSANMQ